MAAALQVAGVTHSAARSNPQALMIAANAAADDGQVIELPVEARREIAKFLGKDVVGNAVAARVIDDPVRYAGLSENHTLKCKIVHGAAAGELFDANVSQLDRQDSQTGWRMDIGPKSWFGEIDANGNLIQYSSHDKEKGVISRFSPPHPILTRGMRPGDSTKTHIEVTVFDLARPDKEKHAGYLDLTHEYVGAFEVTVPAGTFEAALISWAYTGKVGPANISDEQYFFYAEGVGPVAWIQRKDISAMLVYRDTLKEAGVLLERK